MPRISVIIPTYNHQQFISQCIRSILAQTYRDIEVVVVDDGSTDETPQILSDFGSKIKVIRQENKGGAAALNTAIRNSNGEYLAWLSSDDEFIENKLFAQIDFFNKNPGIDLVYTDYYIIDSKGKILALCHSPYYKEKRDFLYHMFMSNFINGASVMFRSLCIRQVGYFDEELIYNADWEMWFRMLKYYNFGHIPKPLLRYRWHSANLSHHFTNVKKFYFPCYKKVLSLYNSKDFFPESLSEAEARLRLGKTLTKYGVYSLGFSMLKQGVSQQPRLLLKLGFWVPFILRLLLQLFLDFGHRIYSLQQRHLGSSVLSKIYLNLNKYANRH